MTFYKQIGEIITKDVDSVGHVRCRLTVLHSRLQASANATKYKENLRQTCDSSVFHE